MPLTALGDDVAAADRQVAGLGGDALRFGGAFGDMANAHRQLFHRRGHGGGGVGLHFAGFADAPRRRKSARTNPADCAPCWMSVSRVRRRCCMLAKAVSTSATSSYIGAHLDGEVALGGGVRHVHRMAQAARQYGGPGRRQSINPTAGRWRRRQQHGARQFSGLPDGRVARLQRLALSGNKARAAHGESAHPVVPPSDR